MTNAANETLLDIRAIINADGKCNVSQFDGRKLRTLKRDGIISVDSEGWITVNDSEEVSMGSATDYATDVSVWNRIIDLTMLLNPKFDKEDVTRVASHIRNCYVNKNIDFAIALGMCHARQNSIDSNVIVEVCHQAFCQIPR